MDPSFLKTIRIFMCALSCALTLGCAAPQRAVSSSENILRLHVVANSDSEADQAVKLRVRDAVLEQLEPGNSAAQARAYLLGHGGEIQAAVEETLRASGFSYGAQLLLGRWGFPDRTYGNTLYPAGDYEALRVVLGRGAGQNWWCVLFPPLCIVTNEAQPLPEADGIVFQSSILNWIRDWRKPA